MNKKCLIIVEILVVGFLCGFCDGMDRQVHNEVMSEVQSWARIIGEELFKLSQYMTRKDKIIKSFSPLKNKIYEGDPRAVIGDTAGRLRGEMDEKAIAAKRIADFAEFLSYHRKTDEIDVNGTFRYYDADQILKTDRNVKRETQLEDEILDAECKWWCFQEKNLTRLSYNGITEEMIHGLFNSPGDDQKTEPCDCTLLPETVKSRSYYEWLPLDEHGVNHNVSVIKLSPTTYNRDQWILQGVRWSEPLDLVFKKNQKQYPTLTYQYFVSPHGFMRHYPAVKWSEDYYDQTYDPRARSWYTEAMTSPKDIVILLDRSGSMDVGTIPSSGDQNTKRRVVAALIVNDILDTLNDNDYVNIYTFTNTTEPLVPCFENTLVQANEENLRLLRESLFQYKEEFAADIFLGLDKAFKILQDFRENSTTQNGSTCNQAIMLISEGIDYDFQVKLFNQSNWLKNTPVRIFTYSLGIGNQDSERMEWIACANRGFFVNVTWPSEVREKVLNYVRVMSRPLNLDYINRQKPIWSYLQIDLADRRYSNYLWNKHQGLRQREIFLDHAKREFMRLRRVLTSPAHMLLTETHDDEGYNERKFFDYLTTVSLPVYGRMEGELDLIGVAAVDVPIKNFKALILHHKLGVNAYAFILTNNGYVLMHPRHNPEFDNIPKPTFNRVDFLEVELLDDSSEPRQFGASLLQLRDNIVKESGQEIVGAVNLSVKFALDDMRRIILTRRRYFYTDLGSVFTLGFALPEKYGLMTVEDIPYNPDKRRALLTTNNWTIHPEWIYFNTVVNKTNPKINLLTLLKSRKSRGTPLLNLLLFDADATEWFEKDPVTSIEKYPEKYLVKNVFVATHSGLTRWRTFSNQRIKYEEDEEHFEDLYTRAIDEDWYKRTVEENLYDENLFVYSVPFETSGFENNTMVTSTSTIFVVSDSQKNSIIKETPVAVVGMQFNQLALNEVYGKTTKKCINGRSCKYTCDSDLLVCFILDNNGYVIISDEPEYTGRFIGDIRPDVLKYLVEDKVYKAVKMYDYQAICQRPPRKQKKSSASTIYSFRKIFENLLRMTDWALATILLLISSVSSSPLPKFYHSDENETLAYEKLYLNKTFPTPCDQQMYLFTFGERNSSSSHFFDKTTKFSCPWLYVEHRIPNSNLLFMAINKNCIEEAVSNPMSPTPMEIKYNKLEDEYVDLPCYIEKQNIYKRHVYMNCYNRSHEEDEVVRSDRYFCGHKWKEF